MLGGVPINMIQCLAQSIYRTHRTLQAQKLPSKVTFVCLLHMSISGLRYFCRDLIRSKYLYVLFLKVRQELTYKLGNNLLMQQHGIQSIANRWPRDLGIRYDGGSFIEISCLVDVSMAYARTGFDDGHFFILADKIDSRLGTPRYNDIHHSCRRQQIVYMRSVRWQYLYNMRICSHRFKSFMD